MGERRPMSSQCDEEVQAAARATVRGMQQVDPDYSLATLLEDSLRAEIQRLEHLHHEGRPWHQVKTRPLRRGRRVQGSS